MSWKLTVEAKELLLTMVNDVSTADKTKIELISQQDIVSTDDLKFIKSTVSEKKPLFVLFNMITPYVEHKTYKASSAFRKKTEKLRVQQENMQYKKLVQSVDSTQQYGKVVHMDSFGAELREVNRQLISVFNVLITVVGSFFFGFSGVAYAYPHLNLDLATRFLIGLVLATIVFFADLYFVVKSMDEPDSTREFYEDSHNLDFKQVVPSNKSSPTTSAAASDTAAKSTDSVKERKKTKKSKVIIIAAPLD